MRAGRRRLAAAGAAVTLAAASMAVLSAPAAQASMNWQHLTTLQKRLASGALSIALAPATTKCTNPSGGTGDQADENDNECAPNTFTALTTNPATTVTGYTPATSGACSVVRGSNVKVNQNCQTVTDSPLAGRGQAQNETSIAIDPNNPQHMLASQNDYRRGDGGCYGAYSFNGGRTWTDTTIPMSFTSGTAFGAARQYWQAGGDTSVAYDSKGNAYFSCQVFNRGNGVSINPDQSSAFYVYRSTGNNGGSWNFPGRAVTEFADPQGAGTVLEDKQLLTVDSHKGSPYQDRVYVTWTEFAADGSAYIYEAYSADYGETFSARHLVSKTSGFCFNTFGAGTPQGKCNENQFSQPFTGSDGALYVTYANYNSQATAGTDNRFQMLLSKSTDGGQSFSSPVKVGDFYDLPDCDRTQHSDPGRSCVPEKGTSARSVFRATNYPSGAVDPTNPSKVVITYGSYINKDSKESNGCTPAGFSSFGAPVYTGAKAAGACNNDILESISSNGGASFSGANTNPRSAATITADGAQKTTDQFWQWAAFTKTGTLAVSYYDRQYGNDETNGSSDISLSGTKNLTSFGVRRVTTASMPAPTQFGGQFYGDYTGLAADTTASPVWMDTRDPELFLCPDSGTPNKAPALCTGVYNPGPNSETANDQNIYTASVAVPTGR